MFWRLFFEGLPLVSFGRGPVIHCAQGRTQYTVVSPGRNRGNTIFFLISVWSALRTVAGRNRHHPAMFGIASTQFTGGPFFGRPSRRQTWQNTRNSAGVSPASSRTLGMNGWPFPFRGVSPSAIPQT